MAGKSLSFHCRVRRMTIHRARARIVTAAVCLGASSAATSVHAGEVYLGLGLPGVTLGYAHALSSAFGVRVEASTLGTRRERRNEEGVDYDARLKTDRVSLLADWYPLGGGFRLTGGIASNNYKLSLDASGAGGSITVGATTYTTTADDGLLVQVKMPRTAPYIGLGWGHQSGPGGFRFGVDLGAYIGKGKVTATPRGQLAAAQAQADVDREVAEIRDGAGKIKALPQLGVSFGYAF
jgi:hypothetical protein